MSTYAEMVSQEERKRAELVIIECNDCGYHSGHDSTYLEQVGSLKVVCPSCKIVHEIEGED